MPLTYTERRTVVNTVTKTLKAPTSFSMYTAAGDKPFHKAAVKLIQKVEEISTAGFDNKGARKWYVNAFKVYFKFYNRARNSNAERMSGAGDTAVRECVWIFALQVANAVDFSESRLDDLWEDYA